MLKETFNFLYFSKWFTLALYVRYSYNFSIFQDNFENQDIQSQFFHKALCIFVIFNIIVLNFSKMTSFSNICTDVLILRQNLIILLPKPTMVYLLFFLWLWGLSITGFVIKIVFTIYYLFILTNVFRQNLADFFRNVLQMLFSILSIFMFYCFVFLLLYW